MSRKKNIPHTHEVPTGPHTDVRKRKVNPSYKKRIQVVPQFKQKMPKALGDKLKKFRLGKK